MYLLNAKGLRKDELFCKIAQKKFIKADNIFCNKLFSVYKALSN